ncbi:hypothetical protein FKM82_027785 [Ascaphus truei]
MLLPESLYSFLNLSQRLPCSNHSPGFLSNPTSHTQFSSSLLKLYTLLPLLTVHLSPNFSLCTIPTLAVCSRMSSLYPLCI